MYVGLYPAGGQWTFLFPLYSQARTAALAAPHADIPIGTTALSSEAVGVPEGSPAKRWTATKPLTNVTVVFVCLISFWVHAVTEGGREGLLWFAPLGWVAGSI